MTNSFRKPTVRLVREMRRGLVVGVGAAILCVGCGGGGDTSGPNGDPDPEPQNGAPAADAGPDQEVSAHLPVDLDGGGSSDPDNDPLTYAWSFSSRPAGSGAALSDATAAQTSFVADLPGTYVVQLIVNDGTVASTADQVTITAVDNSSAVVIGPAGGQIVSKDGNLTLLVPAGALAEDTEIRVTPAPTDDGSHAYDLAPSGLQFAVPVTAAVPFEEADLTNFVDENGGPLDLSEAVPDVFFVLFNDDETIDPLLVTDVRRDGESGILTVTTEISHFSTLTYLVGLSASVRFEGLGTHYVGPTFKRDAWLTDSGTGPTFPLRPYTARYRNMSITYAVRSLTVTRIEFDVPAPVKIESPNPLARDDFLNQFGQRATTRASFFCNNPGEAWVGVRFTWTTRVEATFQPENRAHIYEIELSLSQQQKATCVEPEIGLNNQTFGQDDADETAVAMVDAQDDVSLVENNTLMPTGSVVPPDFADLSGALVSVVGDPGEEVLYVSLSTHGAIPTSLSGQDQFVSFDLMLLDPSIGPTGPVLFDDVRWDLGYDGAGPNAPLGPAAYFWTGQQFVDVPGARPELHRNGQWIALCVPVADLGLTVDEVRDASFRAVTQVLTDRTGESRFFADMVDIPPLSSLPAP